MNTVKILNVTQVSYLRSVRHASWFKAIFKVDKNEPPYSHCVQVGDPSKLNYKRNRNYPTFAFSALRKIADPVPPELIKTPEIKFLCSHLEKVREAYNLVGIACPQIGISLRICILSFGDNLKTKFSPKIYKAKEMSTFPTTVFINPELKVLDHKKIIFEEGCASVVGLNAEVQRNYSVEVTALDIEGNVFKHQLSGWNARIAQHEVDHLNGILFTDIMNPKTLRNTNWEVINTKNGRIEVPYYPTKK